ncbi:MAG: prepilin-type N-terminal cleavage/methylation domain-containing protein [Rhodospirillales bacterium]|nr:prepilin-type N-terminal cleavage/methylation domain-containing protein [Rhodospirillales bacterium]
MLSLKEIFTMQTTLQTMRKDEQGFTLVELAVVMIIIGLLIGGILKGQELITNARITSTIGEMEGLGAAYNDFRNQFNALPGDMGTATTRIANCVNIPACANGAGANAGIIDGVVGGAAGNDETVFFFGQLLAAGYISSMDGSNDGTTPEFGVTNPTSSIEGGFLVGDTRAGGMVGFAAGEFRPGVYLVHNGSVGAVAADGGGLTGQQAANIDRRLDDGIAGSGSILGDTTASCDGAGVPRAYDQAAGDSSCAIAYRL